MAEAKPADPSREASPKLVAVPERPEARRTPPASPPLPRREPERRGISWSVFAAVVALLLLILLIQTERVHSQAEQIGALNGQVEGLQSELTAARTQLATYDMQFALVRTSVATIYEQRTELRALVDNSPSAPVDSPAPTAP
jgi:hypothetical protein